MDVYFIEYFHFICNRKIKKPAGNKVLPKAGLNGFDWTYLYKVQLPD